MIALDRSDSSTDELDLPERCRVVKLANNVTYDRLGCFRRPMLILIWCRMDKAIDCLEKRITGQVRAIQWYRTQMLTVQGRPRIARSAPTNASTTRNCHSFGKGSSGRFELFRLFFECQPKRGCAIFTRVARNSVHTWAAR